MNFSGGLLMMVMMMVMLTFRICKHAVAPDLLPCIILLSLSPPPSFAEQENTGMSKDCVPISVCKIGDIRGRDRSLSLVVLLYGRVR